MVAAMNEHLSSSSATNSIRSTATSVVKDKLKDHHPHHHHHHHHHNHNLHQSKHQQDKLQEVSFAGEQENNSGSAAKIVGILGYPCDFDHMYASMTDGGVPTTATSALGVSPLRGNEARQNDLTEVKHLKELLLLHLDLIQQQSEQIVTKDKLLSALRQENETLKLRLERMDRRVNLQKMRSDNNENSLDHMGPCSPPSLSASLNSLPSTSENIKITQSDSLSPQYSESFKIRLNTSGGVTTVKQESPEKVECKQETMGESWENKKKRKSDPTSDTNISVSKRKRGISSSSTVSNETTSTTPESHGGKGPSLENFKKLEKKSKSLTRRESFLTTEEHYYTAIGNSNFALSLKDRTASDSASSNLEVPMWRVKVYTSCYTMEGTENLDDEIFNKRHLKLENDERRRKRWDVQRIREQRHIEKLKQRQERQSHHSACYNLNHPGPCLASLEDEQITTLWPEVEQIQSIQVDTILPVSAFGAAIPSYTASDFTLPWLVNSKLKTRRPKRLNSRRRKSSRR
ncbi:male-specific lethal 1 homolog isoform X2 [Copidosoma floridanum]|nr:male-specific lethal 1 homolog isoform X2 [Copidosoma floridanum]XP_023247353.1 male-specific lethal 1 homolog isoform X2 [Copidosoma floridanum]